MTHGVVRCGITVGLSLAAFATACRPAAPANVATAPAPPVKSGCEPVKERPGDVILNADNGYVAYLGSVTGSDLRPVSDNLRIPTGWDQPFHESIAQAKPGDHLYVIAWDAGGPQMFVGQITRMDGSVVATNSTDWESAIGATPPPKAMFEPSLIAPLIAGAQWRRPAASAPNGTGPWGTLASFGTCAQFIWHDNLADPSNAEGKVAVFRTARPVR